ncbi:hypothetical protein ACJMK2_042996 [Sinanodonta woodiana]|uniref:Uncharacterized protein n=1 Tax=Sinanodonta woodiana TaxID=1069815 RepID=A0ABD3VVL2_SINWO
MFINADKQGSEGKTKDQVVKHNSSQNKAISQRKSKPVSQNYSIRSLTKLMDKLSLNSADDDITTTADVFSGPKSSAKYSPMVVSVKEGECSEDISSEADDDFCREITL